MVNPITSQKGKRRRHPGKKWRMNYLETRLKCPNEVLQLPRCQILRKTAEAGSTCRGEPIIGR